MKQWIIPGILVLAMWTLWKLLSGIQRARGRRQRDFERTLGTLMQPGERVICQCPGRKGRWILTNKRLVMESGSNYRALPLRTIRQVQCVGADGKKGASPKNTVHLSVKAKESYELEKRDESFSEFVKALKARTARRKKGKTAPKKAALKKPASKKAAPRKTAPKKPASKKSTSKKTGKK